MIGRVLRNFAGQLCDFDLANEILGETNEHDFALTRFETILEEKLSFQSHFLSLSRFLPSHSESHVLCSTWRRAPVPYWRSHWNWSVWYLFCTDNQPVSSVRVADWDPPCAIWSNPCDRHSRHYWKPVEWLNHLWSSRIWRWSDGVPCSRSILSLPWRSKYPDLREEQQRQWRAVWSKSANKPL